MIGLAGGESSGPLPDFVDCESLRAGRLGELIGWVGIEAREAGVRMLLRMWENETGMLYLVVLGYYHDMTCCVQL